MYLRKSLLSAILICLHGMGSSQVLLSSAALSTLNQPADAAVSCAVSSEETGFCAIALGLGERKLGVYDE